MEQRIPEVFDGTVEIMSVSREERGDHCQSLLLQCNLTLLLVYRWCVVEAATSKVVNRFHPTRLDAGAGWRFPVGKSWRYSMVEDPAEFIYNNYYRLKLTPLCSARDDNKRATCGCTDNKISLTIGRRGPNTLFWQLIWLVTKHWHQVKSEYMKHSKLKSWGCYWELLTRPIAERYEVTTEGNNWRKAE